jgi:hypothetical protein
MDGRKGNGMSEIDFVIAWVDGNDENWIQKKKEYTSGTENTVFYRDWGLLPYLFRSIELYAPWVHHVYLVTDRQIPQWLNTDCAKLSVIDHREFIPVQYLPTFNSHTIELNMHRIKGLTEQFVYFNDDFFLCNPCRKSDFFRNGMPVDEGSLNGINGRDELFAGIQFSNLSLMNRHYSTADCRAHIGKWLRLEYGKNLLRTLLLLPFQRLQGIYNPHGPMPLLKTTCEEVWKRDRDILDATCKCKERQADNVSVYCYRYEQLLSGNFVPHKSANSYHCVDEPIAQIERAMQKAHSICINDVPLSSREYIRKKRKLQNMMERKFPSKSSFENYPQHL